ncbi:MULTISPECIES: hypothetical protein [unclassified Paenibacillus]|uniref:hypothetical protein n=1 Tax=unclassified Paenibacillus TaxID=185978 RepID=UPI00362C6DF1
MNIRMCVSNLDLFAGESAKQAAEALLVGKCSGREVEEVHCLGYCFWCPQSLMALVDGTLVRDYKNYK